MKEKLQKLISIIKRYDFQSIIQSIFAITSWRNNRGAQKNCLALNAAVAHNKEWGNKQVITYDEFSSLFETVYPILQCSEYDDPVLMDFGEVNYYRYWTYFTYIC